MRSERALPAAVACLLLTAGAPGAEPAPERQESLVHLVRHDCGSCHGMTLAGGLGPPLTVPALAGRSPEGLEAAILDGRPGTPMPPWRALLSEDDVRWMVRMLQAGRIE